jgi:hypothetical protein
MSVLHTYHPGWEDVRRAVSAYPARVYEDDGLLIATDFEGGNGHAIERLDDGLFSIRMEPDPGDHRFKGAGYYACVGVRNKSGAARRIRLQLAARVHQGESWLGQEHMVVRRGGCWRHLDRTVVGSADDALELTLDLPSGGDREADTLFVSNFHWWPFSERLRYLDQLKRRAGSLVRVKVIGRSHQGRPIHAVEIGRDDDAAPTIVNAQTTQPSEAMASHACRALIDWLVSNEEAAVRIRDRFRVCVIPTTNPDGTVLGYCVADAVGRFPYFEAHLAAQGDPAASPENRAQWRYLEQLRPWLYWEWHSNNWARRPGHMLLRYRSELAANTRTRALWDAVDERLLRLPNTHHESFTSHREGAYRPSMGFQAAVRLGAVACMIKQHEKYSLAESRHHAVACLQTAAAAYAQRRA